MCGCCGEEKKTMECCGKEMKCKDDKCVCETCGKTCEGEECKIHSKEETPKNEDTSMDEQGEE